MRPQCRGFLALSAALIAAPVVAGEPVAGRYLLSPSPAGFVRLDTTTGATSHCRQQKDGVWRCEPLLAASDTVDSRLEALASEVASLSTALTALDARVAALAPVDRHDVATPVLENLPVTRVHGFTGELVERFLDLVRTLKHGRAGSA